MKQLCILAALAALWGCRAAQQEAGVPISFATTEQTTNQSKALASGDIVGLFATIDGTERYLMENTPFAVDADGRSLSTTPAVYYPDRKEAMNFYAYFPYGSGTSFSVPSDQSTASALQAADLCWAKASSTPIAWAVPLQFGHKLARLVVAANQTPSKIIAPNAFSGGLLDIRTGLFTNTLKSSVSTTGNELILPAQTIARLVLTISGVEYVFEGAIALEAAKTTTANLTLNVATKTATLSGSSTTAWTSTASAGASTKMATNLLTAAWVPVHPRTAEVNKIVLTIKYNNASADYTITTGITQTDGTFRFTFAANTLSYPYAIENIALYKTTELIQSTKRITGGTVYKSGAYTFGVNSRPINPPTEDQIFYYDGYGTPIYWTKGYLVAKAGTDYECMVGAETDMGLYFQFGSLIGWNGAKTTEGVGFITAYTQALPSKRRVYPIECATPPTAFSATAYNDLNHHYFGLQSAPYNGYADIRQYPGFAIHQYAPKGVGDPCSYYLGEPWRSPTSVEMWNLWRRPPGSSGNFAYPAYATWQGGGGLGGTGIRIYNATSTASMFLTAAGIRRSNWYSGTNLSSNYGILSVGWSSYTRSTIYSEMFHSPGPSWVTATYSNIVGEAYRTDGLIVRCVHN